MAKAGMFLGTETGIRWTARGAQYKLHLENRRPEQRMRWRNTRSCQ